MKIDPIEAVQETVRVVVEREVVRGGGEEVEGGDGEGESGKVKEEEEVRRPLGRATTE